TNCGKAHLEGFGSEEGVRKAKGELFDHLRNTGGSAFVNNDHGYLRSMSVGILNVITYGSKNADHTGKIISGDAHLEIELDNGNRVKTQLIGSYNFPNVLQQFPIVEIFKMVKIK